MSSSTDAEPAAKRQKLPPPSDSVSVVFMDQHDIWIQILAFVGMGHYAFVGSVSKKLNHLYKVYCASVQNPPKVKEYNDDTEEWDKFSATATDTFYRVALCNVPSAKFWHSDNSSSKAPTYYSACNAIARVGSIPVLQWALECGFPWDSWTCRMAAAGGHFELLKWAREKGCPWDEKTCAEAARYGYFDILKWSRKNGCPWDHCTLSLAAEEGQFEILKWAHEHGCPWNHMACCLAARYGHLEILKWARENGCPWDSSMCSFAAEMGHLEIK
ncbi:ankyrin containing protein (ISS) [Seminavis robusta]|uniref:Ankyrin containing protein (ISS) n=1 Tax=Seminavis robusta TaxID=568900 RepID=A0A9N8DT99_9STRA|nr:ankyrin containing protein (ISS) [Seminavis robusta]|eukprot:Sro354_g124900.1 ankyrin containing protein (ISS) (272) ;mRNA; f:71165-72075